jgi:hypothetical protein
MLRCAAMSVNNAPTLCLKHAVAVARTPDVEVWTYCTCGAFLGRYWAGPPPTGIGITMSETMLGRFHRATTRGMAQRSERISIRGPRTQPGLYPEEYDGRTYIRKRCPCRPVHNKRGFDSIGDLPITVRDDGGVVLVWD